MKCCQATLKEYGLFDWQYSGPGTGWGLILRFPVAIISFLPHKIHEGSLPNGMVWGWNNKARGLVGSKRIDA